MSCRGSFSGQSPSQQTGSGLCLAQAGGDRFGGSPGGWQRLGSHGGFPLFPSGLVLGVSSGRLGSWLRAAGPQSTAILPLLPRPDTSLASSVPAGASAHPMGTVPLSPAPPVDRGTGAWEQQLLPTRQPLSQGKVECHSSEHHVPVQPRQDPTGHSSSGFWGHPQARASPPGAAPAGGVLSLGRRSV